MASARWIMALAAVLMVSACTSGATGPDADTSQPGPVSTAQMSVRGVGGNLIQPRAVHHATTLVDGRVLITGGCTENGCEGFDAGRRSELFDPAADRFTPGPIMGTARASDTATLLGDGRVLLAGGYPGENRPPTASAEVYDPADNQFLPVADMVTARADHTATLLPNGQVLLTGGLDSAAEALTSTEIFDPVTNTFAAGPPLSTPRAAHTAVIASGAAVLVGGEVDGNAIDTTDVLSRGEWSPGPDLLEARVKHASMTLPDGRILVIGGATSTEGRTRLSTTELLDITTSRVSAGPELSEGEYKLSGAVAMLADGRVVIAGGTQLDVYDPSDGTIAVVQAPRTPRRSFVTATALGNEVLIAGGYDDSITPTTSARLVEIAPA